MERLDRLISAMADLEEEQVLSCVQEMADHRVSTHAIVSALNTGIVMVGKRFEVGEYFIADLIVSGMIYRSALNLLLPLQTERTAPCLGKIVIGVVAGDVHDIGKDIIVSLLRSENFEVVDLGVNVKPERFVEALRLYQPDVLLLSGVLSSACLSMKETIALIEQEGLRDSVAVFIGGACSSEYQCGIVKADSWGYDSMVTLNFCKGIIDEKYGKR